MLGLSLFAPEKLNSPSVPKYEICKDIPVANGCLSIVYCLHLAFLSVPTH